MNIVERRTVIPSGFATGAFKIIDAYDESTGTGIKPEEEVIVSNLQRAREGLEVGPVAAESGDAEGVPNPQSTESDPDDGALPETKSAE